jgi:hypothetical protein
MTLLSPYAVLNVGDTHDRSVCGVTDDDVAAAAAAVEEEEEEEEDGDDEGGKLIAELTKSMILGRYNAEMPNTV